MKKNPREKKVIDRQGEFTFFIKNLFFLIASFCFLALVIILSVSFLNLKPGNFENDYLAENNNGVGIFLDKNSYKAGEKMQINIVNMDGEFIYLEPCEQIKVFEKKTEDDWLIVDNKDETQDLIEPNDFEKNNNDVNCEIDAPVFSGVYRLIVPVFYQCSKPNRYACKESKIFYSEDFEVVN